MYMLTCSILQVPDKIILMTVSYPDAFSIWRPAQLYSCQPWIGRVLQLMLKVALCKRYDYIISAYN